MSDYFLIVDSIIALFRVDFTNKMGTRRSPAKTSSDAIKDNQNCRGIQCCCLHDQPRSKEASWWSCFLLTQSRSVSVSGRAKESNKSAKSLMLLISRKAKLYPFEKITFKLWSSGDGGLVFDDSSGLPCVFDSSRTVRAHFSPKKLMELRRWVLQRWCFQTLLPTCMSQGVSLGSTTGASLRSTTGDSPSLHACSSSSPLH
ncbi:hypothetical protein YC2023_066822 [Brassica napus]